MRFPTAYYLLLVYLTVMFKPLIPLVSDAYAHVFEESIHLATIHAKYGTNHLTRSLAETGAEDNSNKNHKNIPDEQQLQVHIIAGPALHDFSLWMIEKHHDFFMLFNLPVTYIKNFAPPPKFLS